MVTLHLVRDARCRAGMLAAGAGIDAVMRSHSRRDESDLTAGELDVAEP
jgi:hypothetical protein